MHDFMINLTIQDKLYEYHATFYLADLQLFTKEIIFYTVRWRAILFVEVQKYFV